MNTLLGARGTFSDGLLVGRIYFLPMTRRSTGRLAVAASLCGALWMAQLYGQQAAKLNLVKVKDDLYVIHNDYVPGNSTALVTNDGVVLVDDKFEVDHDNIIAELKKITDKPIRYVINTHHHADHSGGNARLQQMNVQIVASEQARENMVDGNQPGLPNVVFDQHARVYLGGKSVDLYHYGRAHTNGDVVVYFRADRALAAGDMFTYGDATPQLIDYAGGGSAKEWTQTLDQALELDFEAVVPGHGDVTTKQEMRKFRDSTLKLRNRIHELLVQKKTRDDIARMLQSEFHWAQLHLDRGLDGAMAELQ
jgi:cyclase